MCAFSLSLNLLCVLNYINYVRHEYGILWIKYMECLECSREKCRKFVNS